MLYLNVLLAWITLILAVLLVIIWIVRLLLKNKILKSGTKIASAYGVLRKNHKLIAIMFIVVAIIHGLLSSFPLLSLNWGTAVTVLAGIMGIVIVFRTKENRKIWANVHRVLVIVFIAMTVLHLTEVGGFPNTSEILNGNDTAVMDEESIETTIDVDSDIVEDATAEVIAENTPQTGDENTAESTDSVEFIDGVYIGVADAYGPDLTLQVTIENGEISEITVVSHNENKSMFYQPAFDTVIPDIIESQTTEVDSVSGSTYTSVGIKNAVRDALRQAVGTATVTEDESLPSSGKRH